MPELIKLVQKMKLPQIEQSLCYDEKNQSTYLVTTGATLNNNHYLTTAVITNNYKITDTTLRKKYVDNGIINKDYFYSDNKVLVGESFLEKMKIKRKNRPNNTDKIHNNLQIPYTKAINKQDQISTALMNNNYREFMKRGIINEIKQMKWDDFITIATGSFMSQDDWDVAMMNFVDLLSQKLKSKDILAAYSTEKSINIRASVITKYDSDHRHVHLLLNRNNKRINNLSIKKLFLKSIKKTRFKRYEYHVEPFNKNLYGENYILKTYNNESDCFSLVAPLQSELAESFVR